jgi:hypothetical protein
MELDRYTHFAGSLLRPHGYRVILILWNAAPGADLPVCAKWIGSVLPKLLCG